jgi:hypothetical protein
VSFVDEAHGIPAGQGRQWHALAQRMSSGIPEQTHWYVEVMGTAIVSRLHPRHVSISVTLDAVVS